MDRGIALILTLATGALIAFQPPANALLARHVGSLGAAFVSLLLSTAIVGVLLVAAGQAGTLSGLGGFQPVHLTGAVAGAAVVVVSIFTVRSLGAGGVAAALVATQILASLVADRLGWFGLQDTPLTGARVAGAVLLIAGTVLITAR